MGNSSIAQCRDVRSGRCGGNRGEHTGCYGGRFGECIVQCEFAGFFRFVPFCLLSFRSLGKRLSLLLRRLSFVARSSFKIPTSQRHIHPNTPHPPTPSLVTKHFSNPSLPVRRHHLHLQRNNPPIEPMRQQHRRHRRRHPGLSTILKHHEWNGSLWNGEFIVIVECHWIRSFIRC